MNDWRRITPRKGMVIHMKRILCLLLVCLMIFTFMGCDGDNIPPVSDDPGTSETPDTGDGGGNENEPPDGGDTVAAPSLKVMSFNMQTGGRDSVADRAPLAIKAITEFDADVVGAQEVNCFWIDELEALGFFETYTMVGEARQGDAQTQSNEYSCIFYKTALFDLIDSGTYWLSNTPEVISKLDDSDYYRIMSYALLERKSDGKRFLQVSTHLEWNHVDAQINLDQTQILLMLADGVLEEGVPAILVGDFNEPPTSEGYAEILSWDYEDARIIASKSSQACTFFDGYRGEMTDPDSEGTILDYCFVSAGAFTVKSFSVGTDCEASDHFPVFVEMSFAEDTDE